MNTETRSPKPWAASFVIIAIGAPIAIAGFLKSKGLTQDNDNFYAEDHWSSPKPLAVERLEVGVGTPKDATGKVHPITQSGSAHFEVAAWARADLNVPAFQASVMGSRWLTV